MTLTPLHWFQQKEKKHKGEKKTKKMDSEKKKVRKKKNDGKELCDDDGKESD